MRCATAWLSPLKAPVDTVLPQAARPAASRGTAISEPARFIEMWPLCSMGRRALRLQAVGPAVEEGDLAHVLLPQHLHQQAGEPEAEAAVGRGAVTEEVQVVPDRLDLHALLARLLEQHVVAVLRLGAGGDLDGAAGQGGGPR